MSNPGPYDLFDNVDLDPRTYTFKVGRINLAPSREEVDDLRQRVERLERDLASLEAVTGELHGLPNVVRARLDVLRQRPVPDVWSVPDEIERLQGEQLREAIEHELRSLLRELRALRAEDV